ncbi:MAG: hypothetical protein IJ176_09045 [Prevotella sp.]|nr:hypothetical protein [Prevotella sp.]
MLQSYNFSPIFHREVALYSSGSITSGGMKRRFAGGEAVLEKTQNGAF